MDKKWAKGNPFEHLPEGKKKEFNTNDPFVVIVQDFAREHSYYIRACLELEINYIVIDLENDNWKAELEGLACKVILFWPTIYMKDHHDKLMNSVKEVKANTSLKVFPSEDLLWIYENKINTLKWLEKKEFPFPNSWVFFNKDEALRFVEEYEKYPLVLKTSQGAAASGVFYINTIKEARKWIEIAFSKGILLKNRGKNDRHSGYIFLQEHLGEIEEWRLIGVGDSFFCRKKIKVGEFYSGSGKLVWTNPPTELLDETKKIQEMFDVPNVNVDFFRKEDGRFYVNEIHALWGGKENIGGKTGRFLQDNNGQWQFEEGNYFKNRCANIRLEWIQNNWL